MKKILNSLPLVLSVILLWSCTPAGEKAFEGVIKYQISYPGTGYSESKIAMFPKELTVTIKGSTSKTYMTSSMGTQTEIINYSDKSKVSLLDLSGQKFAVKLSAKEVQKNNSLGPVSKVKYPGETKTILGYPSKKAFVTAVIEGDTNIYEAWFTDKLGSMEFNFDNPIYKDVHGILMEYPLILSGLTMKYTVTSIEKKDISSDEFDIPSEYRSVTTDELKKIIKGE